MPQLPLRIPLDRGGLLVISVLAVMLLVIVAAGSAVAFAVGFYGRNFTLLLVSMIGAAVSVMLGKMFL